MEKLTHAQQKLISKFLTEQLKKLNFENRIGRLHFDAAKDKVYPSKIINAMAETIYQ